MSDESAFLDAIKAEPADDVARLVFADWLEEHGGRPERAEFVRVQCELARTDEPGEMTIGPVGARPRTWEEERLARCAACRKEKTLCRFHVLVWRERVLLVAHPAAAYWGLPRALDATHPHRDVPANAPVIRCHGKGVREIQLLFRRGFAEQVTCEAGDWLRYADELSAHLPVTGVHLTSGFIPGQVHRADGTHYTLNAIGGGDCVLSVPHPGPWTARFPTEAELVAAKWPRIAFGFSRHREPKTLLVQPGLEETARRLLEATEADEPAVAVSEIGFGDDRRDRPSSRRRTFAVNGTPDAQVAVAALRISPGDPHPTDPTFTAAEFGARHAQAIHNAWNVTVTYRPAGGRA